MKQLHYISGKLEAVDYWKDLEGCKSTELWKYYKRVNEGNHNSEHPRTSSLSLTSLTSSSVWTVGWSYPMNNTGW